MARDEVYEAVVNCSVYKEDVAITRIDLTPRRVELEFEDKHKEVWYSKAEAIRLIRQQYKLVKR